MSRAMLAATLTLVLAITVVGTNRVMAATGQQGLIPRVHHNLINPQPEPPRLSHESVAPGQRVMINPQPEPPGKPAEDLIGSTR